jgi:hypothetical protein
MTGLKLVPPRLGLTAGTDGNLLAIGAGAVPSWVSSDARVATVDADGRVKALAKGSAVITATSGSDVATSTLTVYQTDGPSPATSDSLIDSALARTGSTETVTIASSRSSATSACPPPARGAGHHLPAHLLLRELMTRRRIAGRTDRAAALPAPPIIPTLVRATARLTASAQARHSTRQARHG